MHAVGDSALELNLAHGAGQALTEARVDLLYRQLPLGIIAGLAVSLICALLWVPIQGRVILVWFAYVLLVAFVRLLDLRLYNKAPSAKPAREWERRACYGAAAQGVGWGVFPVLAVVPSYAHQVFIVLIVGLIAVMAMVILAPSRLAFWAFIGPAALGPLWKAVSNDDVMYQALALLTVAVCLAMLRIYDYIHRCISDNLSYALAHSTLLSIFDSVTEGIVVLNQGVVEKCNKKFAGLLGYDVREIIGKPLWSWSTTEGEGYDLWKRAEQAMRTGQVFRTEQQVKKKNGELIWCEVSSQALANDRQELGAIWVYTDITYRKALDEEMRHLANHDALTGLANRRGLETLLQKSIEAAVMSQGTLAVMLIDLDGFKAINDQHGHAVGDQVLRILANRLQQCVRGSDTIIRFGGDEFVIVLSGDPSTQDIARIAEKILMHVAEPFSVAVGDVRLGASIGISVFPSDGGSVHELLKKADAAMYEVKDSGKNSYKFYSRPNGLQLGIDRPILR